MHRASILTKKAVHWGTSAKAGTEGQEDSADDREHHPSMGSGSSSNRASEDGEAPPGARESPSRRLPPIPLETSMVVKVLVEFLLKNKLHKDDLFLREGRKSETKRLLQSILNGNLPQKLSQYASRSICAVITHLLADSYAPLFPYESYGAITDVMNEHSMDVRLSGIAKVITTIPPERRALLEALLLLLHKLSLKATERMNSLLLSEMVAIILIRPSEASVVQGTLSIRKAIGVFLIDNAPRLLQKARLGDDSGPSTTPKSNRLSNSESGTGQKRISAVMKASVSMRSVASIIRFGNRAHAKSVDSSQTGIASLPLPRREITEVQIEKIQTLVSAIIESPKSKRDLFVTSVVPESDDLKIVQRYLQSGVDVKLSIRQDQGVADIAVLGFAICEFLSTKVEPLLGADAWTKLEPVEVDGPRERCVRALQVIIKSRSQSVLRVLLMLLACTRLALDGDANEEQLVRSILPCLIATDNADDPESTASKAMWVGVLVSRMNDVLSPLFAPGQPNPPRMNLGTLALVVFWAMKCKQRALRLRNVVKCANPRGEDDRGDWETNDALCASLVVIVETLIDRTVARPLEHKGLYMERGDDNETAMLVGKLMAGARVNDTLFSSFSLAKSLRTILGELMRPLLMNDAAFEDINSGHLRHILGGKTGMTPIRCKLARTVVIHFDMLQSHETTLSVRSELQEVLAHLLFQPPVDHRAAIGFLCCQILPTLPLATRKSATNDSNEERPTVDSMTEPLAGADGDRGVVVTQNCQSDLEAKESKKDDIQPPNVAVGEQCEMSRNVAPTISDLLYRHKMLPKDSDSSDASTDSLWMSIRKLVPIRIADIVTVIKGILITPSTPELHYEDDPTTLEGYLKSVLQWLSIPDCLASTSRTADILREVHVRNRHMRSYPCSMNEELLVCLELLESIMIAARETLSHPALLRLYPDIERQLEVVLDVWGLADPSTIRTAPDMLNTL